MVTVLYQTLKLNVITHKNFNKIEQCLLGFRVYKLYTYYIIHALSLSLLSLPSASEGSDSPERKPDDLKAMMVARAAEFEQLSDMCLQNKK